MVKNMAVVGEVDAGKSALLEKILDDEVDTGKTQSIKFYQNKVLDTPGEFIENRAWYGALLSTISNVSIILYLQPADKPFFSAPAGLLNVYSNKKIIGIISKIDAKGADVERATRLLRTNRVPEPYFQVSIYDQDSIKQLRDYLQKLNC